MLSCEDVEALLYGVRCRTLRAKTIRVWIAQSLRDGFQGEQVQSLHRPVMHRGDRQGALAVCAIILRNVDAPERERAIAALSQFSDGACFLLRGVPKLPVYPRGLPAIVVCHPLHGKGFAAKRVGQEML